MSRVPVALLVILVSAAVLGPGSPVRSAPREVPTGAFVFEQELTLPGAPLVIYDAITGDLSGWWDHTFSENPYRLYLEAKPGGGFWEIFDEEGNGVRHAVVLYADPGRLLRFEGPLGLSGNALNLVCTYTFTEAGPDSTRLLLSVHGEGEMQEGWPETVESVWHHFLFDRFQPYVESGGHLEK